VSLCSILWNQVGRLFAIRRVFLQQ
jgi:hypothetical protein